MKLKAKAETTSGGKWDWVMMCGKVRMLKALMMVAPRMRLGRKRRAESEVKNSGSQSKMNTKMAGSAKQNTVRAEARKHWRPVDESWYEHEECKVMVNWDEKVKRKHVVSAS